jgi:hypothetical protein
MLNHTFTAVHTRRNVEAMNASVATVETVKRIQNSDSPRERNIDYATDR